MSWFPQKFRHWTASLVDAVLVVAIAAAVVAALLVALVFVGTRPTRAHHWYEPECCSGRDCFALEDGEIVQLPGNDYLVVRTGEVFGHPDSVSHQRRARWSKDSRFHRCTIDGTRAPRESICIYVPPPSF